MRTTNRLSNFDRISITIEKSLHLIIEQLMNFLRNCGRIVGKLRKGGMKKKRTLDTDEFFRAVECGLGTEHANGWTIIEREKNNRKQINRTKKVKKK